MNLRAIHKAFVLFLMLVSVLMPARMGMGQYQPTKSIGPISVTGGPMYLTGLGVASDGVVYISDYYAGTVQRWTQDGTYLGLLGDNPSSPASFSEPCSVAFDADGNIYVAEAGNHRVMVYSPTGGFLRSIGSYGTGLGELNHPNCAYVTKSGYLLVSERLGSRITCFTLSGTPLWTAGVGIFRDARQIAEDSAGNIYVSDCNNGRVCKFTATGTFVGSIGSGLSAPTGLVIDDQDNVVVSETYGNKLSIFNNTGQLIQVVGAALDNGFGNINFPHLLTKGLTSGVFYMADAFNNRVLKLTRIPDLTSPTSTFSASPATTWSNTDVTATITSTDNVVFTGVKEIHYSINMGAEQIVSSATATFTLSDNGIHSISYFAVDNAGNTETTQLATVMIDKIAPVTTLARNAGLITLSATDAHSGLAKTKYQVNGGAVADYSVPFADTIHKVTYWAEDVAGNSEAAKTDIINAGVQAISVTQPRVTGGIGVVGTVTLDKAAGVGGTVINLASSLPGVAVVDATVTVPEGATTATFDIDANPVAIDTSVSITASIYETSQSALITVTSPAPVMVTWSASPVVGGTSTTGTLIISGPAPTGGTTVSLASTSLSALVGSSITIPAGAMTATFIVSTNVVSNDTSAILSATVYGVKLKSTLSILGPKVTSVTLAASSVVSLGTTTGTITLSTNAPVGGKVVTLSSSNASVASVPVSVTVAAGTKTAIFTMSAGSVNASSTATITAATNGSTGTVSLTVTTPPAAISGITTNVTAVTGGLAVTGTVTLTNLAPMGGAVIVLASSPTTAGTVPASVTVAAGATTATFTITTKTVTAATTLSITGSYLGVAKVATITVNPARVVSTLTLNPTTVKGGTNSTGTITLTGIATENVVVSLTSGTTTVATVPASVTVLAGSSTATFSITTLAQTATRTSIITARTGTTSRTATLSVTR